MSSLVRRIQKKGKYIGYKNPNDKSLLARLAREEKRKAKAS